MPKKKKKGEGSSKFMSIVHLLCMMLLQLALNTKGFSSFYSSSWVKFLLIDWLDMAMRIQE